MILSTAGSADAQVQADPTASPASLTSALRLPAGFPIDMARLKQLGSGRDEGGFLIRSASSLTPHTRRGWFSARLIAPEVYAVNNNAIPFSINDGSVWAGVGTSTRLLAGFDVVAGPLRVIVAPELLRSDNDYFLLRDTTRFYAPPVPKDRAGDGFVFPWYALGPYSIDLPTRFGDEPIERLDAGQSTAMLRFRNASVGISNENQWWGPGIRNALILSNNAPGFPHLFLRTEKPWRTRLGDLEARLLVGGLTESKWFDTTDTNNLRSLSAFAFSIRPAFAQNLTLGGARAVYETTERWEDVPWNLFHAFMNTGRPNNRALSDSALSPGGRDQIFSLFGRWVFPEDGFETYVEWARLEFPYSLRDLLVAPNHSHGWTIGLQYARDAFRQGSRFRMQGEITTIEQSPTFRDRPQGSFYTSRKVIQGYTQRGQSLGAAIGPGASSQWLALDYLEPVWSFGIFGGRIRWNQDIHSTYGFPIYQGYCIHDVSVFPGARGSASSRWGYISADVTFGNRLNAWFQEQSGCPRGDSMLDIRNRTITLTVGTFTSARSR